MATVEDDDIRFEIDSPPKSCLELLRVLRDLERFVIAKIDWYASWPPVNRSTPGRIVFPVVKYVGQTQTHNEKLFAEHQARCFEFSAFHQILLELFDSVDLPCPIIPSFDSAPSGFHSGEIPETVYQARDDAYRFWIGLASNVQAEVFNRKELVSTWIPQCPPACSDNETSSGGKVYPHFPIRSIVDLEKWVNDWIQRCSLPEPQKPSLIPRARSRSEAVTITVPAKRRPFQRPVDEKPGRCSFDDILRELHNCHRTLLWLGEQGYPTWESDPPSFVIAENRLIAMSAWINKTKSGETGALTSAGRLKNKANLKPCQLKAMAQYKNATVRNSKLKSDREIYDWLKENVEDDDDEMPSFASWVRYVREARAAESNQKNTPGFGNETHSVVPSKKV